MAWTQTDLDALEEAMAGGELTVRTPDGRYVTYNTIDDMLKLWRAMKAEIASTSGSNSFRHSTSVFCDDC